MGDDPANWHPERLDHPWCHAVSDLCVRVVAAHPTTWPSIESLNQWFVRERARAGVRFVAAPRSRPRRRRDGALDVSSLYEVGIVETGDVPTRAADPHDLFNALAWLAFPLAKRALTEALADLQRARASGRSTLPGTRSRRHDLLALVDEGGLLSSGQSGDERLWVFGHGLCEHAYLGATDVRATRVVIDSAATARTAIDTALAELIGDPTRLEAAVQRVGVPIDQTRLATIE